MKSSLTLGARIVVTRISLSYPAGLDSEEPWDRCGRPLSGKSTSSPSYLTSLIGEGSTGYNETTVDGHYWVCDMR